MAHASGPIKGIIEEIEEEIEYQKLLIDLEQNRIFGIRFINLNKKAKKHILEIHYEKINDIIDKIKQLERKRTTISCG